MTSTPTGPRQAVRRRASRPAGPTNGKAAEPTAVRVPAADPAGATPARKVPRLRPRNAGWRPVGLSQSWRWRVGWSHECESAPRWRC